ncbi:hypothetical protein [Allostreptomyces psammosilenae]|uniref:Uncharacterized protein n=1 Tax=Allostreptomyces psammosilenae TaxID=1892865 RepID=A0A853A0Y8_9ACTN|nr:hypothetical protein [Allostreptomyces psammosilenae]NYI07120.1 hypothetical protein [Allostreptomyces psammosilenae]
MPALTRIARTAGKVGFGAARGGWRLRRAAVAAEEAERKGLVVDVEAENEAAGEPAPRFTTGQAVLLVRYLAGKLVLGRLELLFLVKYAVGGLGVLLLPWGVTTPIGIVLLVLAVLMAGAQWVVSRIIGRLGGFSRMRGAETELEEATTVWWPNLKREMRRVGLPDRAWPMLQLAARHAGRRTTEEQRAALADIRWRSVLPARQLRAARRALAEDARRRGEPTPPPTA